MEDSDLTTLPNIGKVLANRLNEVGIQTSDDLKKTGSENVFIRLKAIDDGACINELLALEGAIQGIRWHNLDKARKDELTVFRRMLNHKK